MSEEISNKSLALIVIIAISISVIGTILNIYKIESSGVSGFVTSNATGTARVQIASSTVLRFITATVEFGSGSVNTTGGYTNCTMYVNDSVTDVNVKVGCEGFNDTTTGPFIIENAGTTFLNVTINASDNATTFIGGSNATYQYMILDNENDACKNGQAAAGWTTINRFQAASICTNLSYVNNQDELEIGIKVSIPYDASTGQKTTTILAQGTSY